MIKKYIIAATILFFFTQCGSKKVAFFPTSEVTYLNYEQDVLGLRVLGYGLDNNAAIEDAQMKAIETLFFRGIPNSNISNPLLGANENELKRKHLNYFKSFFGGKRYLTFISETNFISAQNQNVVATKIDKKNRAEQDLVNATVAAVDIYVNVKSLRKDLEVNNVIRKFGF